MLEAVLFDMDGVLINTEPIQSKAFEVVLREYGKQPIFNKTGVIQKVGVREKDNWDFIKTIHGLEEDTAVLMKKRGKIFLDLLGQKLTPQPGLMNLLLMLDKHHIKMAVASSSAFGHIETVLSGLNIRQYFAAVVSGQFLPRGKPYPDIFIEAAKELAVNPRYCLVLEDSQTGVEAGKAAGAKVIAVLNEFTVDQDISKADLVIPSLQDITWEKLKIVEENLLYRHYRHLLRFKLPQQ